MIKAYEHDYALYLKDQMTKFESFESELYIDQIVLMVNDIFGSYEKGLSVLDFCCGDGTGTSVIASIGFSVEGFDGNINKIHRALRNHPKLNFFYLEVSDLGEISDKYDIIFASHCFEHFLNPMQILRKSRRLLKEGGYIILVLPYPNEECEGHPGSNLLKLNMGITDIVKNFTKHNFEVHRIEKMKFREPELLIILQ